MTKKQKIGVIGFGNMGKAIADKVKSAFETVIFDKDTAKTKDISRVFIASDLIELADISDVIILAVKPQDFDGVLDKIRGRTVNKLVVSIAAGKTTRSIEKKLGKVRVIRVMPNLPAKISKGMTCLCKGAFAGKADLQFARKIFNLVGETLIIDERMMDKATAVSGSGPGFLYSLIIGKKREEAKKYARLEFLPVFTATANTLHFKPLQARKLAKITTFGSIDFFLKSKLRAEDLVKQVASKGGTTEAGLNELKGNIKFLPKAVKAAVRRAKELSRG
jgi:pyrroline-5-carboxylate reductase